MILYSLLFIIKFFGYKLCRKELELSFKNRYMGMTFRDCFRIFGTVNRSSVAPVLTEKIAFKI